MINYFKTPFPPSDEKMGGKAYKRRAAGGRVPGIGTGVTSRMSVIVIPAATMLWSTCPRPREGPCISR